MEKWQLAGIISNESRNEVILPTKELRRPTLRSKKSARGGKVSGFFQTTLRKMTEVIALF